MYRYQMMTQLLVVLSRVYGLGTEAIIDREAELENMEQLARLGEGSQLFAAFNNGIAYQFLPGQLLTPDMTQDPTVFRQPPELSPAVQGFHYSGRNKYSASAIF